MTLSASSLDWIAKATHILNSYSPRHKNYTALEGLPCAGKTTTINSLLHVDNNLYVVDELRLPPDQESCIAYLMQEPLRTQRIQTSVSRNKKVLGDRSIISTLAHKATLLTYKKFSLYVAELEKLNEIACNKEIILPSNIVVLAIQVHTSIKRQQIRDREILEGRLWYDRQFLGIINEATEYIIGELFGEKNCVVHRVDSEIHSMNEVRELVKEIMENY